VSIDERLIQIERLKKAVQHEETWCLEDLRLKNVSEETKRLLVETHANLRVNTRQRLSELIELVEVSELAGLSRFPSLSSLSRLHWSQNRPTDRCREGGGHE
jgi:hypothetical protein